MKKVTCPRCKGTGDDWDPFDRTYPPCLMCDGEEEMSVLLLNTDEIRVLGEILRENTLGPGGGDVEVTEILERLTA